MNKAIIAVLILAIIGVGVWYATKPKTNNETKNDSQQTQNQDQASVQDTSLKSLLATGKDQMCTYNLTTQDGKGSGTGTFYITKNKSRGDIQAVVSGGNTTSHIISMDDTAYFWIDDSDTAFKMNIDQSSTASSSSQAPIDPNTNYKFDCKPWTVDQSKFTVPSTITFREFVMPAVAVPSNADQADINPGYICDSLSEPAKSECQASLKKR